MSAIFDPQDSYSIASQEDRSAPRTRISIPATLRPSGSKGYQTTVNDLSLSGFSAMAINRMHTGSICWLTLPGLESLQAEVIWWNNGLVGCAMLPSIQGASLMGQVQHSAKAACQIQNDFEKPSTKNECTRKLQKSVKQT